MNIELLKSFKLGDAAIIQSRVKKEQIAVEVYMEFDEELGRMEVLSPFDNAVFMIQPDDKFWLIATPDTMAQIELFVSEALDQADSWMDTDEDAVDDFHMADDAVQAEIVNGCIDDFFNTYTGFASEEDTAMKAFVSNYRAEIVRQLVEQFQR